MIATAVSRPRGAGLLVGTSIVARRVLLKFIRTPQLVLGGLAQMALFLSASGMSSAARFDPPGLCLTSTSWCPVSSPPACSSR
jgi:hypothetical protein